MAENTVNTIQIQAYTPAGFRVQVTVDFQSASDVDNLLQANGYMVNVVGAEPGEEVETVTHVSMRNKTNDDGTITPHVAFYIDNESLEYRWAHTYLNNDKDIQDFETATGLKVSSIPVFPADNHPQRKPDKMNYIVNLASPIKVARKQVEKSDGTTRNYFERYVTSNGSTPPAKVWNKNEMTAFWKNWNGSKGIEDTVILKTLGVSKLSEWTHSLELANERMELAAAV